MILDYTKDDTFQPQIYYDLGLGLNWLSLAFVVGMPVPFTVYLQSKSLSVKLHDRNLGIELHERALNAGLHDTSLNTELHDRTLNVKVRSTE